MNESFVFLKDYMPDWFMNMVTLNKVILEKCNFNKYNIKESRALYGNKIIKFGDKVTLLDKNELKIN